MIMMVTTTKMMNDDVGHDDYDDEDADGQRLKQIIIKKLELLSVPNLFQSAT